MTDQKFKEKASKKMEILLAKYYELEDKVKTGAQHVKTEMNEEMEVLKEQIDKLDEDIKEAEKDGKQAWHTFEGKISKAAKEIEIGFERAFDALRKKKD